MVAQQFCPRRTISPKLFWVVVLAFSCLLVRGGWCAIQPSTRPTARLVGKLSECGHSAPTVTPGFCVVSVFRPFSSCFRPLLPLLIWISWAGGSEHRDGVQSDSHEEGGKEEHKVGRNIPGFSTNKKLFHVKLTIRSQI